MSSITRLVVLGAVHQFQPVHGYFLRRELLTWHVDEWANVQAGSIYNALRSLEKDGYVEESSTEAEGKRPARTTYSITPEGEVEFLRMFRSVLWNVEIFDAKPVMVVPSFMNVLSRQEVVDALAHRVSDIDAIVLTNAYNIDDTTRSSTTPGYVREIFELSTLRLRAEQQWARDLRERLLAGDYVFAGEKGSRVESAPELVPADEAVNGAGRQ
ncbi:PadR family transcriptional regulator [Paenarthrobacter sp. YIM B13468]|uniref:PadR family transcriptional regulator n=1 Tax=Paenarthrobacter sp. YIM B13468 TaxID=3366295 RepID=UPI0036722E2F